MPPSSKPQGRHHGPGDQSCPPHPAWWPPHSVFPEATFRKPFGGSSWPTACLQWPPRTAVGASSVGKGSSPIGCRHCATNETRHSCAIELMSEHTGLTEGWKPVPPSKAEKSSPLNCALWAGNKQSTAGLSGFSCRVQWRAEVWKGLSCSVCT